MINRNDQWSKVFEEDLQYIVSNCRSDLKKISNKSLLFTGGGGFLGYYFYHVMYRIVNQKNLLRTNLYNSPYGVLYESLDELFYNL